MYLLDFTAPTPAENLALDEVLLLACENKFPDGILRFWESPKTFVVLGRASRISQEVSLTAAHELEVEVLRRVSGGCSVVQGPGCLNYALILRADTPNTKTIAAANSFIMERQRRALQSFLEEPIGMQGDTDLTLSGRKFSGNSQRRLRDCLLFHGTILYDMDLNIMERLLKVPGRQPDYRKGRTHGAFVCNAPLRPDSLKKALRQTWNAVACLEPLPTKETKRLVRERYLQCHWNLLR